MTIVDEDLNIKDPQPFYVLSLVANMQRLGIRFLGEHHWGE